MFQVRHLHRRRFKLRRREVRKRPCVLSTDVERHDVDGDASPPIDAHRQRCRGTLEEGEQRKEMRQRELPSRARGTKSSCFASMEAMVRVMKEAFKDRLTLHKIVKLVLIRCDDLQSSAPLVFSYVDALESKSFNF
ncbi:hypothetical protein BHE74_00016322 [Ensete ventricosum]|nr:hypothetical protein BHE74_00016322 [Ensete ventricosum]